MTTSMWICAHLPLHGTFRGKLLIWLNLSCKGTHGAAFECDCATNLGSTFLRWFLDTWGFVFFCTKRSILSSLAARELPREDPLKESFNLGKIFLRERLYLQWPFAKVSISILLKGLFHLRFQAKFSTSQNGLTVYCAGVPRPLIHWRPLWDFELVLRRQKHRQEGVSNFQPLNVTALVDIFGLHCVFLGWCKVIIMWSASIKGSGVDWTP